MIHVVLAEDGVVEAGDDALLGELKAVAYEQQHGVEHEHAEDEPRQHLAAHA